MYWLSIVFILRISLCNSQPEPIQAVGARKYLLYAANPGEGFNLRRDVHMRVENLVRRLRQDEPWVLVLPPWPHLVHWRSAYPQGNIPWSMFFDLDSLNEYVPSIEYDDFLKEYGHEIDRILYLQNYAEGWTSDTWEDKIDVRDCIDNVPYIQGDDSEQWKRLGPTFSELRSKEFHCMSAQGYASILTSQLLGRDNERAVLVDRFEQLLHDDFWGDDYWNARKSMVYAEELRKEGNHFMKKQYNYIPDSGKGRKKLSTPGPFMAAHLRRADYLFARPNQIPSIEGAAQQLNKLKKETGLDHVFLASDASEKEHKLLKKLVTNLVWYKPKNPHLYGDGGVAIIDQWICAHASYFVGSFESTFSFRIREDRQMLGMTREDTFNDICGIKDDENDPHSCEKPTYWHRETPS